MAKKVATKTKQDSTNAPVQPETKPVLTKKAVKNVEASTEASEEDVIVDENLCDDSSLKKKRTTPTREIVMSSFDDIIESVEKEIDLLRDSSNKTKGVKFLRTLGKKLKLLKSQSTRIISKRNPSIRKVGSSSSSGFLKPVPISKDIAKFAGWDVKEMKSRVEVTKALCNYIKEHNLQNESDKRQINPDSKLCKLLNFDPKTSSQPLTYFYLQTLLKDHFPKSVKAVLA